jgi:flagellar motor protein MotB
MARKQKQDDPPPSKAYLVSFGDTMTALLAFFIVLLSLAEEQTGANLHAGTGSFVQAINGVGLPGAFTGDTSARAVQQQEVSPLYMAEDLENRPPDANGVGPDEDNGVPVLDRENEVFQRFLNELERFNQVDAMPETEGEAVFDLFNFLNRDPPHLKQVHQEALLRVLPALRRPNYRIDLIVWANMPSPREWEKAGMRAAAIEQELTQWARLDQQQRGRLRAMGKPWRYADAKRPVLSIVVRKLEIARD